MQIEAEDTAKRLLRGRKDNRLALPTWLHDVAAAFAFLSVIPARNLLFSIAGLLPAATPDRGPSRKCAGTHTGHYVIHRLVYFEYFHYVRSAIALEKQLKRWIGEQK